jgi:hypothetical protein
MMYKGHCEEQAQIIQRLPILKQMQQEEFLQKLLALVALVFTVQKEQRKQNKQDKNLHSHHHHPLLLGQANSPRSQILR